MLERRGRHAEGGDRDLVIRGSGPRDSGGERVPQDVAVIESCREAGCRRGGAARSCGRRDERTGRRHAPAGACRVGATGVRIGGLGGLGGAEARADTAEAQSQCEDGGDAAPPDPGLSASATLRLPEIATHDPTAQRGEQGPSPTSSRSSVSASRLPHSQQASVVPVWPPDDPSPSKIRTLFLICVSFLAGSNARRSLPRCRHAFPARELLPGIRRFVALGPRRLRLTASGAPGVSVVSR